MLECEFIISQKIQSDKTEVVNGEQKTKRWEVRASGCNQKDLKNLQEKLNELNFD